MANWTSNSQPSSCGRAGAKGATGATGPTGPAGTFAFTGPTGAILYFDGTDVSGNAGFTYGTGGQITANMNFVPTLNDTYSLGTLGNAWKGLTVGPATITIIGPPGTGNSDLGYSILM